MDLVITFVVGVGCGASAVLLWGACIVAGRADDRADDWLHHRTGGEIR
jgi:hypothetical protein